MKKGRYRKAESVGKDVAEAAHDALERECYDRLEPEEIDELAHHIGEMAKDRANGRMRVKAAQKTENEQESDK